MLHRLSVPQPFAGWSALRTPAPPDPFRSVARLDPPRAALLGIPEPAWPEPPALVFAAPSPQDPSPQGPFWARAAALRGLPEPRRAAAVTDHRPQATPPPPGRWTPERRDYRLPAQVHPAVLSDRPTQLAGNLYLPAGRPHAPLIVLVPGNANTCLPEDDPAKARPAPKHPETLRTRTYTFHGECEPGWKEERSHDGLDYLAEDWASRGFATLVIDMNRINSGDAYPPDVERADDDLLVEARARLIRAHLEKLVEWNAGRGERPDLAGRFDLRRLALAGHSRGGTAALLAAADLGGQRPLPASEMRRWRDLNGHVEAVALLELASARASWLDAPHDLHAMNMIFGCDEDVGVDLPPRFDFSHHRADTIPGRAKISVFVGGGTHAATNPIWPEPQIKLDRSPSASGPGSIAGCPEVTQLAPKDQRRIVQQFTAAFFEKSLGDPAAAEILDPAFRLGPEFSAAKDLSRDYLPGGSNRDYFVLTWAPDSYRQDERLRTKQSGDVTITPMRFPVHSVRSGYAITVPAGGSGFAEVLLPKRPRPPLGFVPDSLDLSVADGSSRFSLDPISAQLEVVRRDGTRSRGIELAEYSAIKAALKPFRLLETVRVPLADLGVSDPGEIAGVRLTFAHPARDIELSLAELRLTRASPEA